MMEPTTRQSEGAYTYTYSIENNRRFANPNFDETRQIQSRFFSRDSDETFFNILYTYGFDRHRGSH